MFKIPKEKQRLALIPWFLPLLLLLPYAAFVENFRLLLWVWKSGYWPFWLLLGLALLGASLCSYLLYRLHGIGMKIYYAVGATLLAHVSYMAMQERQHSLLVFIFFLLCAFLFFGGWASRLLSLPFFHSKRNWWESYPKALPGIMALLVDEKRGLQKEGRLTNFGETGCFVFFSDGSLDFSPKYIEILAGESKLLESEVDLVEKTKDGFGCGLRFLSITSTDKEKNLRDSIERLRRAGYVAS